MTFPLTLPISFIKKRKMLEGFNNGLLNIQKDYKDLLESTNSPDLQAILGLAKLISSSDEKTIKDYLKKLKKALIYLENSIDKEGQERLEQARLQKLKNAIIDCMQELISFALDVFPHIENFVFLNLAGITNILLKTWGTRIVITPEILKEAITITKLIIHLIDVETRMSSLFSYAKDKGTQFMWDFIENSNAELARMIRNIKIASWILKFRHHNFPVTLSHITGGVSLFLACKQVYSIKHLSALEGFKNEIHDLNKKLHYLEENAPKEDYCIPSQPVFC